MSHRLTCPRGHNWDTAEFHGGVATAIERLCPECGSEALEDNQPTNPVTVTPQDGVPLPNELPIVVGYEVLSVLGRGGMGVVYKARQLGLKRLVALKMVLSGAHAGPNELARFKAEAEAVAQLQHPNIVQIYEIGECQGKPFFSLEFVDGGSLAQRIRGSPLPPRQAAHIAEMLADAVHYAHQRGIVHRDLKPANILLAATTASASNVATMQEIDLDAPKLDKVPPSKFTGSNLIPKIADFGLAKRLSENGKNITRTGYAMGTPHYMAPEQALGNTRDVGPSTDIYSLGVILYEMLAGRVPFQADNPLELMSQVVREEPPSPLKFQPNLPADLVTICLKCLRKEAAHRYESAEALAEDIRRFLNGLPIHARPQNALERLFGTVVHHPAVILFLLLLVSSGLCFMASSSATNQILVPTAVTTFSVLVWQWRRAERQRGRAVEQRQQADESRREAEEHRLIAENARREAVAQAQKAAQALRVAESHLYSHRITLAEREWQANNVVRVEEVLGTCPANLRSWEWHYLKRLLHTEIYTFHGHKDWVRSVAFHPMGGRILSAGGLDQVAKIWEPLTGKEIRTLTGHTNCVRAAAYSTDGNHIATAADDKTVRVYDNYAGSCVAVFTGHEDSVLSVAFSPDGKRLVSAGMDCTLRVWNLSENKEVALIRSRADAFYDAVFSPDGNRILAGGKDRSARIYDAQSGAEQQAFLGHTDAVTSVRFSPDGRRVATAGGHDGSGRIWDAATGQELHTLRDHAEAVWQVVYHPRGEHVATVGADGTVKIWDAATGKRHFTLRGHTKAVSSAAFSTDGQHFATACTDGTVKVWNALTPQEAVPLGSHTSIESVAFRPDGNLLATGSATGTVKLWDVPTRREVTEFPAHEGCVISLSFSLNNRTLVSGGSDGLIRFWDSLNREEITTHQAHVRPVTAVIFSPDKNYAASASIDGTAKIWDLPANKCKQTFRGHIGQVTSVAYHPHGRLMASASIDPLRSHIEIKLWLPETGEEMRTIMAPRQSEETALLCFSPNGRYFASASHAHSAKIWDSQSGHEISTLYGHGKPIIAIAFSPDGQRVVTASQDHTLKIWNVVTGHEVLTLRGSSDVIQVIFSPNGRQLVTAHRDGMVRFW